MVEEEGSSTQRAHAHALSPPQHTQGALDSIDPKMAEEIFRRGTITGRADNLNYLNNPNNPNNPYEPNIPNSCNTHTAPNNLNNPTGDRVNGLLDGMSGEWFYRYDTFHRTTLYKRNKSHCNSPAL